MGEKSGEHHFDGLLGLLRASYGDPRPAAGVPLLRASDSFGAYRKGPFAMYALREYVGREPINVALRHLIDRFGAGRVPLATTLDLHRELKSVTRDSLQYLLSDLFEKNTFWDLRAKAVTAERTGETWRVTLDALAQKVVNSGS